MKKLTILLLAVICLSACKTMKYLPAEKIIETKTEIKEVLRDTTVYVPADQATINALLECDSLGNVLIKNIETLQGKLNARASLKIQDNKLTADCQCDSLAIYLQLKEKFEKVTTDTNKTKIIEKEKNLAWWQLTLMWAGGIFFIILIIVIYKTIKNTINDKNN